MIAAYHLSRLHSPTLTYLIMGIALRFYFTAPNGVSESEMKRSALIRPFHRIDTVVGTNYAFRLSLITFTQTRPPIRSSAHF
jgi:hypothetical protein